MDQGAKRWMLKTVHKNYWRMASWMDVDDLIQEGYAAYYKALRRYPDATDAPHIMRLFQVIFINRLTDLANQRTNQLDSPLDYTDYTKDGADAAVVWDHFASKAGMVDLPKTSCPSPLINSILSKILSMSGEELRKPYAVHDDGSRETLNERLCRMVGLDPKIDVVDMLREQLGG